MLKVITVLGTRPEILRLSKVIPKLDAACTHLLVHTGQNYDPNMSDIFFEELKLRKPDYWLGIGNSQVGLQVNRLFAEIEQILMRERPDRMLLLGDTNSALCAFMAKRYGVRVYHMEAGNRCFSDLVPEEVNRRVIDVCSDVLMPYTLRSRQNLTGGDYDNKMIYVIGNPIFEVLDGQPSNVLADLKLEKGKYFLVTAHRQENVTDKDRLENILKGCSQVASEYKMPVIFARHPHTRKCMISWGLDYPAINYHEPFGFSDFLALQRNALCVLTDSGTVQEECCINRVRCVTMRDNTERPETIECGSNILSGVEPEKILACVRLVLSQEANWNPPAEYLDAAVSDKVVKIVTGL